MAWSAASVYVHDEMRFYYGGYSSGHKIGNRSIGVATLPADRYASLDADSECGYVRTRPLLLGGGRISLNADAASGAITVQAFTASGEPLSGHVHEDCIPVKSDGFQLSVRWKERDTIGFPRNNPVVLEFAIKDSQLYGFSLE